MLRLITKAGYWIYGERSWRSRFGFAIVISCLVLAARVLAGHYLDGIALTPMVIAVLLSSWAGGFGPGIVSLIFNFLAYKFLYIEPLFTLDFKRVSAIDDSRLISITVLSVMFALLFGSFRRKTHLIRSSERRFRALFQSSYDTVVMVNTEGKIVFSSPSVKHILQYEPEQIVGLFSRDIVHPDDLEWSNKQLSQLATEPGTRINGEVRLIRRDGSYVWVEFTAVSLINDPAVGAIVSNFRDISERKRLHGELEQAKTDLEEKVQERTTELALLAELVEASDDAIIRKDLDGNILSWNHGAEKLFGYQSWEILGLPINVLTPKNKKTEQKDIIRRVKHGETVRIGDTVRLRKDGSPVSLSIVISPIRNTNGEIIGASSVKRDITEQKRAHEERLKVEERYRKIIEAATEGVWRADSMARTIFVNRQMANMLGYRPEEMLGRPIYDFMDAQGRAIVSSALERRKQGIAEQYDSKFRRKDGGTVYVIVSAKPEFDSNGKYSGTLAMITDITERKLAEQEIKQKQERLSEAQRLGRMGSWEWNLTADDVVWSDELYRLYGCDPNNFQPSPQSFLELVHPEDRAKLAAVIQEGLNLNSGYTIEQRVIQPDGTVKHLRSQGEVVADSEGRPVKMVGTAIDITEQVEARQRLRDLSYRVEQQATMLNDILSASPDQIYMFDQENRFIYASAAALEALGKELEQVIGKKWSEIGLHPAVMEPFEAELKTVWQTSNPVMGETEVVSSGNGRRYFEYSLNPVRDPNGRVEAVVCTSRDVTERRRIEQMKSDFVSLVSHQLKTPIALIRGYVENLLTGLTGELTPQQKDYLRDIQEISAKNYGLITDLLNVSRIERGVISVDVRPVDLRDVIHLGLRQHLARIERKGIELKLTLPTKPIMVLADKFKMAEAMTNVVDNAIKFTDEGFIAVSAEWDDRVARVTIEDSGRGMTPDTLAKLFTRDQIMSGAPSPEGGSGLGLYIARQFMHYQKGDVTASSKVGRGSQFTFTVPLAKVKARSLSSGQR